MSAQEAPKPKPTPAPAQARVAVKTAPESTHTILAKHITKQAQMYYEGVWGVDSLTVKYTESGEMIRFSYRVLDPEKAATLNDKKAEPSLSDAQAGVTVGGTANGEDRAIAAEQHAHRRQVILDGFLEQRQTGETRSSRGRADRQLPRRGPRRRVKDVGRVIMSKFAFVKTVVAAGGFLFLCAAPEWALGQSSQPGAASPTPMKSCLAPRGKSAAPPDLLEGLTLADDQKAKIDQIREETKSHLAAVANDKKLSPEAADAMRRGYAAV